MRALSIGKIGEESTRRKKHHECSMELIQAFKPHSMAVTSIAMDARGEILASGVNTQIFLANCSTNSYHFREILMKYNCISNYL